ncbi:MAG: hypothetical protein ACUVS2_04910 [Candidatus Flexifilum sp.]
MHRLSFIILIGLLIAGGLSAQDLAPQPAGDPIAGGVILSPLVPDPYLVTVPYGAGIAAFPNCTGRFSVEPSFMVSLYDGAPLYLSTFSDGDTALAVVQPNGTVLCSDDADGTLEGAITIERPAPGRYAVFVGGYSADTTQTAFLVISRRALSPASFGLEQIVARALTGAIRAQTAEVTAEPAPQLNFEAGAPGVQLPTGSFGSRTFPVSGGGPIDLLEVPDLDSACVGFVTALPTLSVELSGPAPQIRLLVNSDEDAVLLVRDPAGGIHCNDDARMDTINPLVTIDNAPAGVYLIYVGAYSQGALIEGELNISEAMR